MDFHHIGIACHDIAQTLNSIRRFHNVSQESAIIHDPHQDADVCLVSLAGGPVLELVTGPQVAGLIKNHITYYHVCYVVDDLEQSIAEASKSEAVLCSPPKPAPLFQGRRVAFLFTPAGMVELLERE